MENAEDRALRETPARRPRRRGKWILVAAFSVVLAVLMHSYLLETFRIPTASMMPTLIAGDHVLVNRVSYISSNPLRGDVVVFERQVADESGRAGVRYFVKRLIGLPGDTVLLRDGELYLNNRHVDEHDITAPPSRPPSKHSLAYNFGPYRLKADQYFMLGDNRENSEDSRYFGAVARESIHGRVFMIYWSWQRGEKGLEINWERVGLIVR